MEKPCAYEPCFCHQIKEEFPLKVREKLGRDLTLLNPPYPALSVISYKSVAGHNRVMSLRAYYYESICEDPKM